MVFVSPLYCLMVAAKTFLWRASCVVAQRSGKVCVWHRLWAARRVPGISAGNFTNQRDPMMTRAGWWNPFIKFFFFFLTLLPSFFTELFWWWVGWDWRPPVGSPVNYWPDSMDSWFFFFVLEVNKSQCSCPIQNPNHIGYFVFCQQRLILN